MKWDSHLGVADSAHAFHVGSRAAKSIGSTFGDWGKKKGTESLIMKKRNMGRLMDTI
jgi:hypothetical protein